MNPKIVLIAASLLALPYALKAQTVAPGDAPVSRKEFEQLLKKQETTDKELAQLKAERAAPAVAATSQPAAKADAAQPVTQDDLDDIEHSLRGLKDDVHRALPGTEHLVIAGDAAVGFQTQRMTNSTFFGGVSPLILWEPTDRLLFEAGFDFGIDTDNTNTSSTSVDLSIADASFIVNDYLIVGGGLFVVPFGQYHNHFDPPWINKLPDDPLAFGNRAIGPGSEVGIFARGAAPICRDSKVTYDVYLANGPNLFTNDPTQAGSLNFDDFTDLNDSKAVGGRLGFLPVPSLEVGYSFEFAETAPPQFGRKVDAFLQAADLNYKQEFHPISGTVQVNAEWIWSSVGHAVYDPNHAMGFGPLSFSGYRDGGYVTLSYRPTLVPNKIVRNLEFVTRYDAVFIPMQAPGGGNEQRVTLGVDYWLTPSAVLKVAYEIDDNKAGPDQNAFFVQFGIGL
jgi:hypothetical protein